MYCRPQSNQDTEESVQQVKKPVPEIKTAKTNIFEVKTIPYQVKRKTMPTVSIHSDTDSLSVSDNSSVSSFDMGSNEQYLNIK
jgi:hypothetical protein